MRLRSALFMLAMLARSSTWLSWCVTRRIASVDAAPDTWSLIPILCSGRVGVWTPGCKGHFYISSAWTAPAKIFSLPMEVFFIATKTHILWHLIGNAIKYQGKPYFANSAVFLTLFKRFWTCMLNDNRMMLHLCKGQHCKWSSLLLGNDSHRGVLLMLVKELPECL